MKLEAALIRNNSPYAEVRAVVDNHDDPATPCGTIRAWVIGLLFALGGAFINQLFSIRQPAIGVGSNVAQLLAYPLGKACERFLPDKGFTAFGVYHSLNPGPFSKKEHMLITIMANVAFNTPYTNNVIWVQYLPQYFNQSFAGSFAYQLVIAIATNFIGYGMAGLTRSLLVYPSYCVWPASLVTVALNSAFHKEENVPVVGPAKRVWRMSRYKFFMITFAAMFAYFWLPDYFFQAMSYFSWITWIAPDNVHLAAVSGMQNGLGLNPLSTFDWNIVGGPLTVPFFATINSFAGSMFSFFIVLGLWYSNAYYTGYLPINSNRVFDNTGHSFNVSRAVDGQALYDAAKYAQYSPAYLTAGNMTNYLFFFALYPATLTYVVTLCARASSLFPPSLFPPSLLPRPDCCRANHRTTTISYVVLYHRHDLALAWRNLTGTFRKRKSGEPEQYDDVHNRLMSKYQEGKSPPPFPLTKGVLPWPERALGRRLLTKKKKKKKKSRTGGISPSSSSPSAAASAESPAGRPSPRPASSSTASSSASSSSSPSAS